MDSSSPQDLPERLKPLEHFRAKTKRLKIHPIEVLLLWVVSLHLVFLPWAIGGMRLWGQLISLALAILSIGIALVPRGYTVEHTGANTFRLIPWPRATTDSSNATTFAGRPAARINLHDSGGETAFATFGFRSKDEVKVAKQDRARSNWT